MVKNILVVKYRAVSFLAILFFTMLPVVVLPLISNYYHEIFGVPAVRDGVLDLKGFDFSDIKQFPLDGEWEFYNDQLIVSQKQVAKGVLVPVPQPWVRYNIDDAPLQSKGKGSYRIIIKDCPTDIDILAYIPNISSRYRVYMNGILVSGRGDMDMQMLPTKKKDKYKVKYYSTSITERKDVELVIELLSPHIGGLYLTPVLAEADADYIHRDLRKIVAAAFIGILLITVLYIGCIWLWKDQSLRPITLLLIDTLVCIRILVRDEFFEVIQHFLPIFRYYILNSILQIVIFLLPIIFLFCIKQLISLNFGKRMIRFIAIYEFLLSFVMFWCVYIGRPDIQFFICLISYLPFVFIIYRLYICAVQGLPYSFMVLAIVSLTITSILTSALNDFGFLVFNISLFAPGCFIISVVLQLILYIRRNLGLQKQLIEIENLRLKLRDSQVSLMLSQIRPHFLYNSLTAIHMLCIEAPALAAETVMKFAMFLRTNMRFIHSREPIAFEQELIHIKNYVDIEKLRFQKRLCVDYDIQAMNFVIPALTIQPLIENAIRHGASKNINGGKVIFKTYDDGTYNCVEIIDDGPGFDIAILGEKEGVSFGLHNIIFRLKEQMQAEVKFSSVEGQGTTVLILLPKEGKM